MMFDNMIRIVLFHNRLIPARSYKNFMTEEVKLRAQHHSADVGRRLLPPQQDRTLQKGTSVLTRVGANLGRVELVRVPHRASRLGLDPDPTRELDRCLCRGGR